MRPPRWVVINSWINLTMSKPIPLPDYCYVFERFKLAPEYNTGLAYKQDINLNIRKDQKAGKVATGMYCQVRIKGVAYTTSRIVWYLATGLDPGKDEIDHIDNNRLNNNINNLRLATRYQNNYNQTIRKDNSSGFKGISWAKDHALFRGYLNINNKRKHLGYHICPVRLAYEYNVLAKENRNEFAVLNILPKLNCKQST
jgi:hypothetical protein